MYKIIKNQKLNDEVFLMEVYAPEIAVVIKPGQFIILRVDEKGERVPFTMNSVDLQLGSVTIIYQVVGATTIKMSRMRNGEFLQDFVGPLGKPTPVGDAKRICVVGGGLGASIAYAVGSAFYRDGLDVTSIIGFRNKDLIILEEEIINNSTKSIIMTDDGSNGNKGNVCVPLNKWLADGIRWDLVIAIGPIIMMKFVSLATKPYNIKTLVSMNTLMIDGTGMCGGCRVKVGDNYYHSCVDGPDFDGHLVDFDEAIKRGIRFKTQEIAAKENLLSCGDADGK
ncbi:MAG: sulfide/dihydroorotate dehydrogenase-like FAD/NAD-binding protein [Coriobacteriales bacterium]|nr:sulfide/dihydroorotate dehydrogenase-like FAD/NAD-binding protein [Coriobacteriales bacterium]